MPPKIVVITGPTATGKTGLSIELAKKLDGEIVGADSMQVYSHMQIGTAAPTESEMDGVPHHMIGFVSPFESYSVSRYVEDAEKCIADILHRGKLPILVGGTGLYIDSLVSGRSFAAGDISGTLRDELNAEYDAIGAEEMLKKLAQFDPEAAEKLKPNDKKRIVRAFEVYRETGVTITEHDRQTRLLPPRYDAAKIALSFENRADLRARIDRRVELMSEAGLEREVRTLFEMGLTAGHTAMQAIGYKEFAGYINGETSFGECMELVKLRSRQYAKRQLSWLRRDESVHWILWGKEPNFEFGLLNSTAFLANIL